MTTPRAIRLVLGLLALLAVLGEVAIVVALQAPRYLHPHFAAFSAAVLGTTALGAVLGLCCSLRAATASGWPWSRRAAWATINLAPVLLVVVNPVAMAWAFLRSTPPFTHWIPWAPGASSQATPGWVYVLSSPLEVAIALALPMVSLAYWWLHVRRAPVAPTAAP